MKIYDVYFRSDLQWGMQELVADTPEKALEIARRIASDDPDSVLLDYNEACDTPINEIEVCDQEHNSVAIWHGDDLCLCLAALALHEALELCFEQLSLHVADSEQSPEDKEALDKAVAALDRARGVTT
jgi:hypothetical protein